MNTATLREKDVRSVVVHQANFTTFYYSITGEEVISFKVTTSFPSVPVIIKAVEKALTQ